MQAVAGRLQSGTQSGRCSLGAVTAQGMKGLVIMRCALVWGYWTHNQAFNLSNCSGPPPPPKKGSEKVRKASHFHLLALESCTAKDEAWWSRLERSPHADSVFRSLAFSPACPPWVPALRAAGARSHQGSSRNRAVSSIARSVSPPCFCVTRKQNHARFWRPKSTGTHHA